MKAAEMASSAQVEAVVARAAVIQAVRTVAEVTVE